MSAIFNALSPDYVPRGTQPLDNFDPYAEQGWFANADRAMANGLYGTAEAGAAAVGLAAGGLIRSGEEAVGADPQLSDKWFDLFVRPHVDTLEKIDSDAASYGMASQVINGLFRVGSEAAFGGPAGILALESSREAAVEVQRGKTALEAQALGTVRGATMALGAMLPFALPARAGLGPAVVQRLGYGVAANTAFGVSSRAVEAQVLKAAGYDKEAPAVLDPRALAVDAVMGAFFGAAAHAGATGRAWLAERKGLPSPEQVDAAMTTNLKLRDEDSAPTPPRGPDDMATHMEHVGETLTELSDGALQQEDGSWVPRDAVDTMDAMPPEAAAERTPEQQIADLEAKEERRAIQGEGTDTLPPEVAVLDRTIASLPDGLMMPDESGKAVPAKEWLASQRAEVIARREPAPLLQRIMDCALKQGEGKA